MGLYLTSPHGTAGGGPFWFRRTCEFSRRLRGGMGSSGFRGAPWSRRLRGQESFLMETCTLTQKDYAKYMDRVAIIHATNVADGSTRRRSYGHRRVMGLSGTL